MKLFGDFEAVRFQEENLIFVTHGGFLYYIYKIKGGYWKKHKNAGNDWLTVSNYLDISKEELMGYMNGVFPSKETDFMRLCRAEELRIRDMFDILREDYGEYIEDDDIHKTIHRFLLESDVRHRSYKEVRKILDNALHARKDKNLVVSEIRKLCLDFLGRDIFKKEIGIVDGHDSSSYFWIMPTRVIDFADTGSYDNVAEMRCAEISIEENDVAQYLTPFLYKYFDDKLEANKNRVCNWWENEEGNTQYEYVTGFEWYLTHNFFTFEQIENILKDMSDTIEALISNRDTDYTKELKKKRGFATCELLYAKNLSDEQIKEYNESRPTEDDTESELIIDFYNRFIYRMEYMLKVGKEKGYNLISFMGP